MPSVGNWNIQKLGGALLQFTNTVDEMESPDIVLDELHKITSNICQLNVLGAVMFPIRWGDWDARMAFVHNSVPKGWWQEYDELSRQYPGAALTLAQLTLAPFTMSEILRLLQPLGVERWPHELSLKYGMRDSLTCPVGGRWAIAYWSRQVLSSVMTPQARAILFMGATFAAIRLHKLVEFHSERLDEGRRPLTPRELAVLRLASVGYPVRETAQMLGLGEETIRSHFKKAQDKLAVHSRVHAVAQALRRHLIP